MVMVEASPRYACSMEPLPEGLRVHGVRKSAVSEGFVVGTTHKLAALMERKLARLKLIAVMIDTVRCTEDVVLVAIRIDVSSKKHTLQLEKIRPRMRQHARRCWPT